MLGNKNRVTAEGFRPIHDNVFVTELDSGPHMSAGGIIITDDNMTERGIRARWAKVWAVGPEVEEIKPGEWLLVEHGRWTNSIDINLPEGLVRVWRIEWPKAVLLASDEDPRNATVLPVLPHVRNVQAKSNIIRSVAPAIIRNRGL